MREVVRVGLRNATARFSDDAPLFDSRALRARYGPLDAWPADAELGLAVLAWSLGPGFTLRGFREALREVIPAFEAAARAVPIGESSAQIVLNSVARTCLRNGSVVVRWDLDPEILYWPLELSKCAGATFP